MLPPAPDGIFYRIVTWDRAAEALTPVISPEGRFHHDAQPRFMSRPAPIGPAMR